MVVLALKTVDNICKSLRGLPVNVEHDSLRQKTQIIGEQDKTKMSKPAPVQNVDNWRLTENFRMQNPIQTLDDGTRKFILQFDLRQFLPVREEIQVRTTGNSLTVSAKHIDTDANKSAAREYRRSYVLPKDIKLETLTSKLSSGTLTIEAPLPALKNFSP
ncbi:heat shock protein beta-1-like [Mercenaria mercenaria]|uniref:heat shock protein beta-1-like n=1 Tax=Mercenaria mercenaria TaxID=6596 RepID=UPI00234FB507|nr:heat shock protein beta-1-like [Mercenaria mercenaria]